MSSSWPHSFSHTVLKWVTPSSHVQKIRGPERFCSLPVVTQRPAVEVYGTVCICSVRCQDSSLHTTEKGSLGLCWGCSGAGPRPQLPPGATSLRWSQIRAPLCSLHPATDDSALSADSTPPKLPPAGVSLLFLLSVHPDLLRLSMSLSAHPQALLPPPSR